MKERICNMDMTFEKYAEMNNQAINQLALITGNQNEMIKKVKEEAVKSAVDATSLILDDIKGEVAILRKDNELLKSELSEAKEDVSIVKKDNIELKKKVFVLRNNQDGLYNEYKKVAQVRVRKLVGKEGDIRDILFYQMFIKKLHSYVCNILHVSNTGNIMDEDCGTAKGIANKWKPDKKYLRDKYNEYYTRYTNKTLVGEKLSAFEQYIEMTNGGRNLEF
jgi:SpoU rRNA methylase family enzyme